MENLKLNASDYSFFMKTKNINDIVKWNEKAAGLYFNAFVKTDIGELKYGVVSTECAKRDLNDWTSLYLSGRLQKPVKVCYHF